MVPRSCQPYLTIDLIWHIYVKNTKVQKNSARKKKESKDILMCTLASYGSLEEGHLYLHVKKHR